MFPTVPMFQNSVLDTRNIWKVSNLLTRVETLWKYTTVYELRTPQWHGRMLIYFPCLQVKQDKRYIETQPDIYNGNTCSKI